MKQALGYFLAGIFAFAWISQKFCSKPDASTGGDTLQVITRTVTDSTHVITEVKEFHHYHETRIGVPVLTPAEKDSVLEDHFMLRTWDTTFYKEGDFREFIQITLQQNQLKNFFRDFQNLRPTKIEETTLLAPARTRFSLGGSLSFGTDNAGGAGVQVLSSLQWPNDNQVIAGWDPIRKQFQTGALFKISLRKKRPVVRN